MIFTQEAPLTREWFSGRSCIRSNWNKLGVNFEEGGNRSAQGKPSRSGWDRLKLNPRTTFVVEVEGMIGVHYASLTSQGVQHRVFYLDGQLSRYQPRPTGINFDEQTGTGVFPMVTAVPPRTSFEWANYVRVLCSSRKPMRKTPVSGFPRALLSLSHAQKSSGVEIDFCCWFRNFCCACGNAIVLLLQPRSQVLNAPRVNAELV